MKNTATDFDVMIVGAGISGIGMAAHMKEKTPDHGFVIVERRAARQRRGAHVRDARPLREYTGRWIGRGGE